MNTESWLLVVKILLLLALLIASPLAIPVVRSYAYTLDRQDRIWREISIALDTDYIVNVKLSINKNDIYWDMSRPIKIHVEASPIKYPRNASETYIVLHIEYLLDNNIIDYNDYYVGTISFTRNLLINTITLYPTPRIIKEILNKSTTIIRLRPNIIVSTIYRNGELKTISSEYISPFTIYVGLNKISKASEIKIEYARTIVGNDIIYIRSYTLYKWNIDASTPSIWLEITPVYMNATALDTFIKIYTEDKQLLSSEYAGVLNNASVIKKEVVLPEDIVKAYSQAKGYVNVLLDILFKSNSSSYSISLTYILKCSYEEPALFIDASLPKTVYSGIPVNVFITIRNNDLENVYLRKVLVIYEDKEYTIDVDKILSLGESFIKEVTLKFDSSGKTLVRIVAEVLLLERYTELNVENTIEVHVVSPLVVSVDKRVCLPGEKLVLTINTVFINKTVSIIMGKINDTVSKVVDTLIVSFPGTKVEIVAPEDPGSYMIQVVTSDNIRSNIVEINVSVISYKVSLMAKNTRVEPSGKIEFTVRITPSPKESLDIAMLRFEELMGTWILVPGTITRQADNMYTIVVKAPDKPGNYKFKAQVALKGKVLGESNSITISVGNVSSAQINATSSSLQTVTNQTTYIPLIPPEYTIGILIAVPIASVLLWRKYRRR